jgi:hypothetical protein
VFPFNSKGVLAVFEKTNSHPVCNSNVFIDLPLCIVKLPLDPKRNIMTKPDLKNLICTCLLLFFISLRGMGQHLFQDPSSMSTLNRAIQYLYNDEFDRSVASFDTIRARYAGSVTVHLFDCLMLYWKNFPVVTHPEEYEKYRSGLLSALDQSDNELSKNKKDPESIFYNLLLNIMLARQRAEEDKRLKAAGHVNRAYGQITKGFKLQGQCSEFYFSTGLYMYYREFYPEQHPLYKPFLFMFGFPSGDKAKGLAYLDSAVEKAIFTRAEALMFASYIHLRYENDVKKGLYYAEMLNRLYHNNLFFKTLYIENLIQSGSYEKALAHLDTLSRSRIAFYRLPVALFHGMLSERYYDNSAEAEYWYKKAIGSTPEPNSATGNYVGLASYGLANIYRKEGNTKLAGTYYRKACKLCTYITVKKESCKY